MAYFYRCLFRAHVSYLRIHDGPVRTRHQAGNIVACVRREGMGSSSMLPLSEYAEAKHRLRRGNALDRDPPSYRPFGGGWEFRKQSACATPALRGTGLVKALGAIMDPRGSTPTAIAAREQAATGFWCRHRRWLRPALLHGVGGRKLSTRAGRDSTVLEGRSHASFCPYHRNAMASVGCCRRQRGQAQNE